MARPARSPVYSLNAGAQRDGHDAVQHPERACDSLMGSTDGLGVFGIHACNNGWQPFRFLVLWEHDNYPP